MLRRNILISILFATLLLFYVAWATGFTFTFTESRAFPNYDMLARAFSHGSLSLQEGDVEDCVVYNGKRYMFSGPMPALLRLPLMLAAGVGFPTSAAIAVFCTGFVVMFAMALRQLAPSAASFDFPPAAVLLLVVAAFNGYTLFLLEIPLFHHEAIAAAAFFLTAALYLSLRVINSDYRPDTWTALLLGAAFAATLASRFSYVFATALLSLVLLIGMLRRVRSIPLRELARNFALIFGITALGMGALLLYNYARFDDPLQFGARYQDSLVFKNYFMAGKYFRYDHIPFNLWSVLFRLPSFISHFPYILLPLYVVRVQSVMVMPYSLINANELAASVILLMPVTLLSLAAFTGRRPFPARHSVLISWTLAGAAFLQALSSAATVAAEARYYFDFLPPLLLLSFIGAQRLSLRFRWGIMMVALLSVLSLLLSFAVPMNGISPMYAGYVGYFSPLSHLFFPPAP